MLKWLAHICYAVALVLFVSAVVVTIQQCRRPEPSLLLSNAQFVDKAKTIQDIEHLRKLLFVVIKGADDLAVSSFELTRAATETIVALCLGAAGLLVGCARQLRKGPANRHEGSHGNAP